ncbi:MAG TPA: hypothetical protein VK206_03415, partial [Anaerolineales bacterium]|nr:hypothetical protein [Anaerolineales bacterium]
MNATRAPNYDLFKLIVSILLLVLALILMWSSPPQSPAPTAAPLVGTSSTTPSINAGQRPEASQTTVPTSATSPPLTVTSVSLPSPTVTLVSALTATSLPSPTATLMTQLSATPIAACRTTTDACDAAASRSHLRVGMSAILLRRLNFRSSPGIGNNWLLTNKPGTKVEVIGGPECVPHFTGAYVWWQIKLPDGRVGWSAEGSLHGFFYFMN